MLLLIIIILLFLVFSKRDCCSECVNRNRRNPIVTFLMVLVIIYILIHVLHIPIPPMLRRFIPPIHRFDIFRCF
jgi:hypothetical protein